MAFKVDAFQNDAFQTDLYLSLTDGIKLGDSEAGGTEEQTAYDYWGSMCSNTVQRYAQKLTIPNRIVTKLSFPLYRVSSPSGTISFKIRRTSNDSVIVEKDWGNAGDLPAITAAWLEVIFDNPVNINEEVRLSCEGDAIVCTWGVPKVALQQSDVKGDEYHQDYYSGSWHDHTNEDLPYKYTYAAIPTGGVSMLAPVSRTDGLVSGDSPSELGTMTALRTDGVKLSDASLVTMLSNLLRTDGIALDDTSLAEMLASVLRTDGIELSDEPLIAWLLLTTSDTGVGSDEVSLLIDVLLREMIGVLEGITIDETPEAVSESGIGTDSVTVEKSQVYRMVSDVRPLYNIISIIRERYKVSSIIRELYKMKTHVREG